MEDAIKAIRRSGVDKETINICYVVRPDRTLYGYITIRRLILAQPDTLIGDLADTNVIFCQTVDDQETVAKMLQKYDLIALPVVDGEQRLVGIVTIDDAIDVLQEEVTEDIEKMAAMTTSDKPYLKTSNLSLFLHRIPWLAALMLAATFTELIINYYTQRLEMFGEIAGAVLLATIPMLMGTGGNSGSQASVTVIRGLSLGEIRFSDTLRVIWKEFRVSLLCGAALAVVNFGKMLLMNVIVYHYEGPAFTAYLFAALAICLAIVSTIFVAKLIGCTLPILAKRIGFDPAVMAGPFITTIVDVTTLLLLFGIAQAVMSRVL